MTPRPLPSAAAGALVFLAGCIPSNVVATEDRAVVAPVDQLRFDQPVPAALDGLYESIRIEGDAAAGMAKVYYHFTPHGRFTGAALVRQGAAVAFQTLSGEYSLADGRLRLGADAEPASLALAPGHLRIRAEDGTLILRLVPIE